jgi:hypothetical protein
MKNLTPLDASSLLADEFGIPAAVATLAKWRCVRSDGPPFVKVGRHVRYPQDPLREWATGAVSALRHSTSEAA